MEIPIVKLMESSHAAREADPKLAAYLFAGRAFFTATTLTFSGALAMSMAAATALDANSLPEFAQKMKSLSNRQMPGLKGNYGENHESDFDEGVYEFALELKEEMRLEEEGQSEMKENRYHQEIRSRIRKEVNPLGLGSRDSKRKF
ncbi:hypothetical protein HDU98_008144 [Podochytrium sp. JEL0797]|nr:hypothetical protein HDU98_008144 [Podochytrium sp. JEL0797]